MNKTIQLTAIVEPDENGGFVAHCVELDIASQGESAELARANLVEAVELFFETAPSEEVKRRLKTQTFVTPIMPILPNTIEVGFA